ncbi:TIGR04255 family protein [Streptomyces sp. SID6041]|nr:TIGR04255 family protein [Streptomyces sp. SID6041]
MSDREVYPKPPVALVAVEVRHPSAAPLSGTQEAEAKRSLAPLTPISKPVQTQTVLLTTGPSAATSDVTSETFPRFLSRDKSLSVTFRPDAFVVETTRYSRYEALRELTLAALETRQKVAPVDGVERIGIRYINEIRVPSIEAPTEWCEWMDPAVAGPVSLRTSQKLTLNSWQGIALFGDPATEATTVRYGPLEGYAVNPGSDLRRKTPPPGPFFLVDIDSFWTPREETPSATAETILPRLNNLNESARVLFESLITDRLRNEVFRNEV